jgi:ankyrin repeat protein
MGLQGELLHNAAANGQMEVIKLLLKKIKNIDVEMKTFVGWRMDYSPLHAAVLSGCEEVVMLLAGLGDVNIQNVSRIAPLHVALLEGNGEMVELLLRLGAKVNLKAYYDVTPLHVAVESGNCTAVKWLLKYGGKFFPQYQYRQINSFISANVDAMDARGNTPLSIAVARSNGGTAQLLVKAGARFFFFFFEHFSNFPFLPKIFIIYCRVTKDILALAYDPQIVQILQHDYTQNTSKVCYCFSSPLSLFSLLFFALFMILILQIRSKSNVQCVCAPARRQKN